MNPLNTPFAPLPQFQQSDSNQMAIDATLSSVANAIYSHVFGFEQAAYNLMGGIALAITSATDKHLRKVLTPVSKMQDNVTGAITNQIGIILESTPIVSLPYDNELGQNNAITVKISPSIPPSQHWSDSHNPPPDLVCPPGEIAYLVDCKPLPDGTVDCIWACKPIDSGGPPPPPPPPPPVCPVGTHWDEQSGTCIPDLGGPPPPPPPPPPVCPIGYHWDAAKQQCLKDDGTGNGTGGTCSTEGDLFACGGSGYCANPISLCNDWRDVPNTHTQKSKRQSDSTGQQNYTWGPSLSASQAAQAGDLFFVSSVPYGMSADGTAFDDTQISPFSEGGAIILNSRVIPNNFSANELVKYINDNSIGDKLEAIANEVYAENKTWFDQFVPK